jgi:hypothetical protein
MSRKIIDEAYKAALPLLTDLETEARHILQTKLQQANIKIHSVVSRIKSLTSIVGKAKKLNIKNPMEKLNDCDAGDLSDLVGELKHAGYTRISQLDDDLNEAHKAFKRYESDHPPMDDETNEPGVFTQTGATRIPLQILRKNLGPIYEGSGFRAYTKYVGAGKQSRRPTRKRRSSA